jgi:hypothetical protein
MRLSLPYLCVGLLALPGCGSLIPGGSGAPISGYGSGVTLPAGAELIDSSEEVCRNNLQFGAETPRIIVERGETAAFAVTDRNIAWYCVADGIPYAYHTKCKRGTTFARVTRPNTGNNFLIECFK